MSDLENLDPTPREQIVAGSELADLVRLIRFTPGQASGFLHSQYDAEKLLWRWFVKWTAPLRQSLAAAEAQCTALTAERDNWHRLAENSGRLYVEAVVKVDQLEAQLTEALKQRGALLVEWHDRAATLLIDRGQMAAAVIQGRSVTASVIRRMADELAALPLGETK